jgi:hypothetical protein
MCNENCTRVLIYLLASLSAIDFQSRNRAGKNRIVISHCGYLLPRPTVSGTLAANLLKKCVQPRLLIIGQITRRETPGNVPGVFLVRAKLSGCPLLALTCQIIDSEAELVAVLTELSLARGACVYRKPHPPTAAGLLRLAV